MGDYIVHKAIEVGALGKARRAVLDKTPTDWIVSPKYDGCHAVFLFDGAEHVITYSRSGEVNRATDHIAADLILHYGPQISQGLWAVCGEVWMEGKEFNEISGAFRRYSPQPQLQFVPFDIVPWAYNMDSACSPVVYLGESAGESSAHPYRTSYHERIGLLHGIGWLPRTSVLRPVFKLVCNRTLAEVLRSTVEYAKELKGRTDNFFDGAILAHAYGKYTVGAGKGGEFIKVKPLISYSVIVNGCELAKGEKTGKNTAALTFMLDGVLQRVSTGLTQDQVDDITDDFEEAWKGVCIEVEGMGKTINGYLREPRFKGIRTDA